MKNYRIAVIPGDGIGPEVMAVALDVVQQACLAVGTTMPEFTSHLIGAEHYRHTGETLPESTLEDCRQADAVLLAALGLPDVRLPDNTEIQPHLMVGLRRGLGLYAAVRPIKLYPGTPSVLKTTGKGIDLVILRENLEGLFASFGGGCIVDDQVAIDNLVITRSGTQKIVDFAFQLSRKRQGRPLDGKRVVTCVDKANIFRSFGFFRKIFHEIAQQYTDIQSDCVYVDAMSLYLVQNPQAFDVLVMENQFGDILSDLGAGLVGGLGLAPSAEIGEHHALFQPSHGTAPQLAGKDVANPLAMILSAGMMLDWIGEKHSDSSALKAGRLIEAAVARVLQQGKTITADLGGTAGTKAVGQAVIAALGDEPAIELTSIMGK